MQPIHRPSWKLAPCFIAAGLILRTATFAAIPEDFVRQSYPLSPTATVSIRNTDGRIMIYGSSEPRLEIVAMRRAFSKERLEALKIEVSIEGDVAKINTIYPPVSEESRFADRSGTVDYLIFVPENCALATVELAKGEMIIEGMRGERVEARLDRGVVHVRDCFSAVRVHLGHGRLHAYYGWWETGRFSLSAEVAEGDLHVAVPAGAAMHFDATAEQGKIVNYFAPEPRGVPRLDEHFGGESEVEFKLQLGVGDNRLERAY